LPLSIYKIKTSVDVLANLKTTTTFNIPYYFPQANPQTSTSSTPSKPSGTYQFPASFTTNKMTDTRPTGGELPLTFGVEIECLFGINKRVVLHSPALRWLYPQHFIMDSEDQIGPSDWFDPTDEEPRGLCQAATILRCAGRDVIIKVEPKDPSANYHRWNLTLEEAVITPDGDWEIAGWTDGKITGLKDWRFTGLELISPILKAPNIGPTGIHDPVFDEVNHYLSALTAGPPDVPWVWIGGPEVSSVHVHIGLEHSEVGSVDIPINVLKHVAWICLIFEDVINLFHHPERHGYPGTKIHDHSTSNRSVFRDGGRHHTCDTECPPFSPEDVFLQLFGQVTTHDDLKNIMCVKSMLGMPLRNNFVNFSNVADRFCEPTRTVEFRQHHGTLSAEEINEWVYFLTALVRAAERKANEQPTLLTPLKQDWLVQRLLVGKSYVNSAIGEMVKYTGMFMKKERTMRELFDLMDLPIERRRYWWARAQTFRSDKYAEYFVHGQCAMNGCLGEVNRDAEGWEEGEIIEEPWDTRFERGLDTPASDVTGAEHL
jgi:hypothetical protein